MNVLLILEDQELDRFIVKPVIEALFADIDVVARVEVLPEPRLRGASDALDPTMVRSIVTDNPMTDLFLLVVDRDCNRQGHDQKAAARAAEHTAKMIECVAVQEVEVWLIALYSDRLDGVRMSEVRDHCDPKEAWALPLLETLGSDGPGGGRKRAMRELSGKFRSLADRCVELRELQRRIQDWRGTGRSTP